MTPIIEIRRELYAADPQNKLSLSRCEKTTSTADLNFKKIAIMLEQ